MAAWEVTTAAASLEFDTQNSAWNQCIKVDANHFLNFWRGGAPTTDGFVQVFTVNTTTWAVTTAAASLQFETDAGDNSAIIQVDTNHFVNAWQGPADDGFMQVFTVNTTTWAVTTAAASLEFDATDFQNGGGVMMDANHFFFSWFRSGSNIGYAQVFTVNTTTWAVTTAAAALSDVEEVGGTAFLIDTTHVLSIGGGQGAQVFTVNTTTWAVTTAAAALDLGIPATHLASVKQIDTNHFIAFYPDSANDGDTIVLEVNTTTWAVTTAAASLEFDAANGQENSCAQIDSTHYINFWSDTDDDGRVQTFTVNTSTWEVTTAAAVLEFETQTGSYHSCARIDTSHFINFFQGTGADGFVQVFTVELPANDLSISIFDAVAVAESITMMVSDEPNIFDAVAITEAVTMMVSDDPSVFDSVTVSEVVTVEVLSGPSGDELITLTEEVTVLIEQLVPDVFDAVTVTEVVALDIPIEISVADDIAVAETVGMVMVFDAVAAEDITVTESVTVEISVQPSVFDAVTITESVTVFIAEAKDGLIHYRSTEQSQPIMMDDDKLSPHKYRSTEASYPVMMDEDEIR